MDRRLPQLFDTIVCDRDFPELSLEQSSMGTIIECHGDQAYEVEFCDDMGVPVLITVISLRHSTLEWDADQQTWRLKELSEALKKAFHSLEIQGQPFFTGYLAQTVAQNDWQIFVDAWSETHLPKYRSLREVLGMTEQEFELWEGDHTLLPQLLQARQQTINPDLFVGDRLPKLYQTQT